MKSSVETKVAAAIAVSFVALTVGVVAQENNQGETHQPGQEKSIAPRELSNAIRPGLDGSFSGRKSGHEASIKSSDGASQRIVATEVAQSDHLHDD